MSSSNTEINSNRKDNNKHQKTVDKLKSLVPEDQMVFNISLKRLQEDVVELYLVDEDGEQYVNLAVEEVLTLYDPLMKTLKVIVKSESN